MSVGYENKANDGDADDDVDEDKVQASKLIQYDRNGWKEMEESEKWRKREEEEGVRNKASNEAMHNTNWINDTKRENKRKTEPIS